MAQVASGIDRVAPSRRPAEIPAGYQQWWDLLFLHWRIEPAILQALIPSSLTIDTFDGSAWVGMVLFRMSGVRHRWFPALPWLSTFPETNVRTYVHRDGEAPGVWFFSLDASCWPAVRVARWKWHLNYFHSRMSVRRDGANIRYESRRVSKGRDAAEVAVQAEPGDPLNSHPKGGAIPGTVEHFLAERYVLYACDSRDQLYTAQVHHWPYPLRTARAVSVEETLLAANRINPEGDVAHAMFSEGVDVEVFPLRRL